MQNPLKKNYRSRNLTRSGPFKVCEQTESIIFLDWLNLSYKWTEHILVNVLGKQQVNARLVLKDHNLLQKRHRVAEDPT